MSAIRNPGQIIISNTDVLRHLASHLDTPSLVRTLRACRGLYEACVPKLYHTLSLNALSFQKVMFGLAAFDYDWRFSASRIGRGRSEGRSESRGKGRGKGTATSATGDYIDRKSRKLQALSHCRILSVYSHLEKNCEPFHHLGTDLFPNLEVLRIVSVWLDEDANMPLCSFADPCCFVRSLNATKVVFRNLRADGLPIPVFCDWNPSKVRSVAYYIQPCPAVLRKDSLDPRLSHDIMEAFPKATNIRIAFAPWEVTSFDNSHSGNCKGCTYCDQRFGGPCLVKEAVEVLELMRTNPGVRYDICGLDQIWIVPTKRPSLWLDLESTRMVMNQHRGQNIKYLDWEAFVAAPEVGELSEREEADLAADLAPPGGDRLLSSPAGRSRVTVTSSEGESSSSTVREKRSGESVICIDWEASHAPLMVRGLSEGEEGSSTLAGGRSPTSGGSRVAAISSKGKSKSSATGKGKRDKK